MIKGLRFAFIMLLTILLFTFSVTYADEVENSPQHAFILPSSLQKIEEEAFTGIAAEAVIFPEGFSYIGKNAFSDTRGLTDVYIPKSTKYIDDTTFSISSNLTIHGVKDSYAEDWAEKHQIPFTVDYICNVIIQDGISLSIQEIRINWFVAAISPEKLTAVHRAGTYERKSKRPQDRPELNPIDYRFP